MAFDPTKDASTSKTRAHSASLGGGAPSQAEPEMGSMSSRASARVRLTSATAPSDQTPPLRLRPHHVFCALGYQGKGYSDTFTDNMTRLVTDGLKAPEGDDTPLLIVSAADAICAPCPHRQGWLCEKQSQIEALDRRHARALGIEAGNRLTWAEAKDRIRTKVAPGDLTDLCQGCRWLPLGLCEGALAALHGSCSASDPDTGTDGGTDTGTDTS